MKNRTMSMFLLPSAIAMIFSLFIPLFTGLFYSFTEWNGQTISGFVGIENYLKLLTDQGFISSLLFTAKFTLVSVIGVNVVGLGLALLVTKQKNKLNTFFRTIFFMPNLIGGIILGFIWQFIFLKAFGAIYDATGLTFFQNWLANEKTGFWAIVILFMWQMSGYMMTIYISFLNNIPEEMLEAADIDGASQWRKFLDIKFPMIAPGFTICMFLTLSNAFKIYDQNLALTNGGPYNSTQMTSMNIYNEAFQMQNMGYAQSKAFIFLIIIVVVSLLQMSITRKREMDL